MWHERPGCALLVYIPRQKTGHGGHTALVSKQRYANTKHQHFQKENAINVDVNTGYNNANDVTLKYKTRVDGQCVHLTSVNNGKRYKN